MFVYLFLRSETFNILDTIQLHLHLPQTRLQSTEHLFQMEHIRELQSTFVLIHMTMFVSFLTRYLLTLAEFLFQTQTSSLRKLTIYRLHLSR
ncbi:MAG: hypothetical protein EBT96_12100 [Betaproteobacteria bacterium]|nr:hypothetical protein [Betaproteobacteria bacterium]